MVHSRKITNSRWEDPSSGFVALIPTNLGIRTTWAVLAPAAGTLSTRLSPENTPFNSASSCEQAALPTRRTSPKDCLFLVAQNSCERTRSACSGNLLCVIVGCVSGFCANAVNPTSSEPSNTLRHDVTRKRRMAELSRTAHQLSQVHCCQSV